MHQQPHHQPMGREPSRPRDELPELFDPNTNAEFQEEWRNIQSSFVDDPRSAVARANALVDQAINTIVHGFDRARQQLEAQWEGEGEASTEDLRVCFMRYRSFFHRLLSAYTPEQLG